MKSLLDRLVDNMSQINSKTRNECKERTKTTQYCEFVKLKENRLMYKCLDYEDISRKSIIFLTKSFVIHTDHVIMIMKNLCCF